MSSLSRISQLLSSRIAFKDSVGNITTAQPPKSTKKPTPEPRNVLRVEQVEVTSGNEVDDFLHDESEAGSTNFNGTTPFNVQGNRVISPQHAGQPSSHASKILNSVFNFEPSSGTSNLSSLSSFGGHENGNEFGILSSPLKQGTTTPASKRTSGLVESAEWSLPWSPVAGGSRNFRMVTAKPSSPTSIFTDEAGADDGNAGDEENIMSAGAPSNSAMPRDPTFQERVEAFNAEEIEKTLQNIDDTFCRHFLKGNCRYKSKCKYSHELEACVYCKEKLPKSKVAASTHLSRCWKAALQVGVIQRDQLAI